MKFIVGLNFEFLNDTVRLNEVFNVEERRKKILIKKYYLKYISKNSKFEIMLVYVICSYLFKITFSDLLNNFSITFLSII